MGQNKTQVVNASKDSLGVDVDEVEEECTIEEVGEVYVLLENLRHLLVTQKLTDSSHEMLIICCFCQKRLKMAKILYYLTKCLYQLYIRLHPGKLPNICYLNILWQ